MLTVVNVSSSLPNDCSSFFGSNFGNLNLALPVLDGTPKKLILVLLLNKLGGVWHVGDLLGKSSLLTIVDCFLLDVVLGLVNGLLSLGLLDVKDAQVGGCSFVFSQGISELLLEPIESLDGLG